MTRSRNAKTFPQPPVQLYTWSLTEPDEDEVTLRMKWLADGATNLDEVIEKLHKMIRYVQGLEEQGYELRAPMNDDYGFAIPAKKGKKKKRGAA